jgi:hypothetical protein
MCAQHRLRVIQFKQYKRGTNHLSEIAKTWGVAIGGKTRSRHQPPLVAQLRQSSEKVTTIDHFDWRYTNPVLTSKI